MINPKLALRSLLKSPLITGVAVLSLALGMGANAAIFSLFEQLLLRPVPVYEPDRLVNLEGPGVKSGSVSSSNVGQSSYVFSYPMYRDLEAAEAKFSGLAGHQPFGANLSYRGNTESGSGLLVTGSYFDVLGLSPHAGRLIQSADDQHFGAHNVAVLSHGYWRRQFGSDRSMLDQTMIINGKPFTIIGIAPSGFSGTTLGNSPDVFVPVTMKAEVMPGWEGFDNRRSYWFYAFGRLQPGVETAEAAAAINATYQRIIREVELPLQDGMSEGNLEAFGQKEVVLHSGRRGQSRLLDEVKAPVLVLFSVTGLVLLIACANLINLLMIRSAQRQGEIAVRMSIGARRSQVVAQLLTESFMLALMGGLGGFLVAQGTLKLLLSMMPSGGGPLFELSQGPAVWGFLALLSVVIGLAGLVPALQISKENYATTLKVQSTRSGSNRSANRFRTAMATLQIALSMVLLIAAGLMIKSLVNVSKVELGLDVDKIVTFSLSPELNGYSFEQSQQFFRRVEEEVATIPGVDRVAGSMVPLLSGNNWGSSVSVQGFEPDPDGTNSHSFYNGVGPGFFKTMGIEVLSGREFDERDVLGSQKVAMVNETFAKRFGIEESPVGTWMSTSQGGELDMEIVGLFRDTKYSEVKDEIPPMFVVPYRQDDELGFLTFYTRAKVDPETLLSQVRQKVSALDPNLPVEELQTMTVRVEENIFLDRMLSQLSSAFALLATILAAIGLYGVLAYSVVQRHREIGLRMALGASPANVLQWILRQVALMVVVGGAIGLVASLGVAKLSESLLYEMSSRDPMVMTSALVVLSLVAFGAGFVPAFRAARTHPTEVLRDE